MRFINMAGLALILIGGLLIVSDVLKEAFGITLMVLPIRVSATMIFGCVISIWGAILWLKYGE